MKEKGSILIVSLWALGILFLLAVGLAYRVGLELQMTRYAKERLIAFYAARAGLERAMALLLEDSASGEVDSFQERWSHDPSLFQEGEVGEGFYTISYTLAESEEERVEGEEALRYGMEDEESRIPLNEAKAEVFQRIPEIEETLVTSLRAWRGDEGLSPELLASEDNYYASLERPYARKGKLFETMEELLLVRGMTPSLYETFKAHFTVYGSGTVNLNTASQEVLELLGLEEGIAEEIARVRRGDDGILGTEGAYLFESVSDLTSDPELKDLLGLDQDQQYRLINFESANRSLLSVQSTAFRIHVEGHLHQGRTKKEIVAVVSRSEGKGVILAWHED